MYILGLSSSWGTSQICPAWSPFEHQLTSALSPIWGPGPKPRRPEEDVYSPNGSCSHFTQRLFPPKLPRQHTCTIFIIHSPWFILIIHHIQTNIYILLLHDKSLFHFFGSSWQAGCPRSLGLLCPMHLFSSCFPMKYFFFQDSWHDFTSFKHSVMATFSLFCNCFLIFFVKSPKQISAWFPRGCCCYISHSFTWCRGKTGWTGGRRWAPHCFEICGMSNMSNLPHPVQEGWGKVPLLFFLRMNEYMEWERESEKERHMDRGRCVEKRKNKKRNQE